MFNSGTHQVKMDTKGRMAVPARLRPYFVVDTGEVDPNESKKAFLYLTIHPLNRQTSLWAYSRDEFERNAQILADKSSLDPDIAVLQDMYFSNLAILEVDAQGRILVPVFLREHAQINPGQSVSVVGAGRRIEIWSNELREQYLKDKREYFQTMSKEELARLATEHALF